MYIKMCLLLALSLIGQLTFAAEPLTLNKEEIKEVAFTTSSPKGIGQSSFGHGLLRFRTGKKWNVEKDMAVEFVAPREDMEGISFPVLLIRGIGINNFGVEVYVHPFKVAHKLHTYTQNRTLTNYTLKLTDEQRNKLIDAINGMIKNDLKYNFLKKNCTTFVTDLLEETVGFKIAGFTGNFPLMLPKKLKKKGLINTVFINLSAKKKRNALVDELIVEISKEYDLNNFKIFKKLKKQLKADRMKKRRKGYDLVYAFLKSNQYIAIDNILIAFIFQVKELEKEKNIKYIQQKSIDFSSVTQ